MRGKKARTIRKFVQQQAEKMQAEHPGVQIDQRKMYQAIKKDLDVNARSKAQKTKAIIL